MLKALEERFGAEAVETRRDTLKQWIKDEATKRAAAEEASKAQEGDEEEESKPKRGSKKKAAGVLISS